MNHKLAIDFGTTNTVITRWNPDTNQAETIQLPGISTHHSSLITHHSLIPSLVYVCDGQSGQAMVGQAVRDGGYDQQRDNRLFRNFKRGVVTQVAAEARAIDGALWDDKEAAQKFIRSLIQAIPYRKQAIEQLVLTAPVASFESYLTWLNDVMSDLSERVYIVDESTAAALGYAVTEPGALVLVFDFGGGTLDLSLVQLPEAREKTGGLLNALRGKSGHTARVIAKAGRVLGGSDIDHWLLADALASLELTPADLGDGYAAALTACEKAKIELSTLEETTLEFTAQGRRHSLLVRRADLVQILQRNGFYDGLRHVLDKVMHIAHRGGIFKEDVQAVLLVGGTSLMPSVQAALKNYFGEADIRADKPFTAVAEGALQVAAGFGLDDYIAHSYGLRHMDAQTGEARYDEIIPAGSRYPSDKPVDILLSAAHPHQAEVEFVIGEINGETNALVEVRYENGQTVFVAKADNHNQQQVIPLNEADAALHTVLLKPSGTPGEDRLKARFTVDENRRLRLTVTDLKTHKDLLHDIAIATLGRTAAVSPLSVYGEGFTGREPRLSTSYTGKGQRRLSLRNVAAMLNMLPADSIPVNAAAEALKSKNPAARFGAAQALARRGDREARLALQEILARGEAPSRASAARHLYGFSWYTAEPLLRQALADSDSRVHEAVMYALADFRDLNAYRLMADALQNTSDNVREAAAYGLRDCQDPAAVPALVLALQARDSEVRVKALEALSANGSPQGIPYVRAAVEDPVIPVSYAATLSWLELAGEACVDELAGIIDSKRGKPREMLLRAFFHATNYLNIKVAPHERLIDALESALKDTPKVRMAVIWPLAWTRSERTSQILRRAYAEEGNSEVKVHIVRVASSLMSPVGEELLRDALTSAEEEVRKTAQSIIAERERTGVTLTYDETAESGTGLAKPTLGR